ncbi:glycosyltransferase family 2 protein [Reichenbachiella sp. 5M10]|uniref:glycosyltransferase n=1 Tax=Reichenbachiella sp. 5M10 TaxID=1889772 RepID=UPI000C156F42|nr:glycosyltransferase family 2 protein [Reichenbachiella sp. 5M10]
MNTIKLKQERNTIKRSGNSSKNSKQKQGLFGFLRPTYHQSLQNAFFSRSKKPKNVIRKAKQNPKVPLVLLATFLLLAGATYTFYILQPQFEQLHFERLNSTGGLIFITISLSLFLFKGGFFLYNLFLYWQYKPVTSVSDDELPSCTVIVPAYNEGKLVWETLISIAASLYPEDKIQLIAIDDGSKDDTWHWMKKAKSQLGDRLAIYQQPKNKGKRHALYRGFNLGTGDVFVTIDSDSIVKPDTLRNLVSPFVTHEKCGAVAGNVQVLNNQKAIIPRMLNVSFVLSFEFIRSAQGQLESVLCTPGALAAYRREAVMTCLPEWINQTFMGQPSDIGEDRAMTNMILKQGYHVMFQRNAVVLTNVPENYTSLYKMYIRWERSNVRENIMMSKFVFTPFREGSKLGARLLFVNQWLKVLMAYPFTLLMFVFIATQPLLFVSSTLFSILLFSSFSVFFYAVRYKLSESIWAYSYSILYTFGLFWITPYAIATAGKRGWLTRELPVNGNTVAYDKNLSTKAA